MRSHPRSAPLTARLLGQQISGFQAFCAAVAPLRPGPPA